MNEVSAMPSMMGGSQMPNLMNQQMLNGDSFVDQLFHESLETGPVGGTPIGAIKGQQQQMSSLSGAPQSPQYNPNIEIPMRDPRMMQPDPRSADRYSTEESSRRPHPPPKKPANDSKIIKKLVNDLNVSLNTNNVSESDSSASETEVEEPEKECTQSFTPFGFIKEALLLIIIYVVLSQTFIKRTIGNYIPQIMPGEDQQVSIIGKIIYGGILALLFCLAKMALSR